MLVDEACSCFFFLFAGSPPYRSVLGKNNRRGNWRRGIVAGQKERREKKKVRNNGKTKRKE